MGYFNIICTAYLLIISICYSEEKKAGISYISPEQVKNIGENVVMNCTVDNIGELPVFWNKKHRGITTDQTVVSVNNNKLVNDPRYELVFVNGSQQTFSLKINNIQIHDSGIYECQIVANFTTKITQFVELQVRSPPTIIDQHSTLHLNVEEGQDVVLKCYAEGYPRPTITWTRDLNAILPAGGQSTEGQELRIKNCRKEDRGLYFCSASNNVGEPVQKSVNLEVEFAPIISVFRPKVAQVQGYSIDLECNVLAHPPSQIEWTKDGKILYNDNHYEISHLGIVNDLTLSKVRILSVENHNYGDYQCKATNKMGFAQSRINLYKPVIPIEYTNNKL
ncbi:lachesin-like isoform X2 [Culicoides brevitarsis]|uniref:lachesin-like isoform X2 n=1 Tax=Culicoides brevitarsis TaxID=469753 RepID=UPI00307C9EDA